MQKHRTSGGASSPASLESAFLLPGVPSRRPAARRASSRRRAATRDPKPTRDPKRDVAGRVIEYLNDRPSGTTGEIASTTGEIAKGLEANRGRVAAEFARIARRADTDEGPGGPRIIDNRMGDDRLDEWVHSGPSSEYMFLYGP
jgi:hypothetical protein